MQTQFKMIVPKDLADALAGNPELRDYLVVGPAPAAQENFRFGLTEAAAMVSILSGALNIGVLCGKLVREMVKWRKAKK
jgi:hypothetical protein